MSAATRNVRIEVSPEHFAILADAMCLFSKNTRRFQSFRATVQHACRCLAATQLEADVLTAFPSAPASDGAITVWLEVKSNWADDFDEARRKVAQICEKPLSDRVAIPLIVSAALSLQLLA